MRARPRRSALLAAALVAVLAPAAAADQGGSADAALGATTAHVSWRAAQFGVAGVRLTVTRDGATTFDGDPFAGGDCADGGCSLAPLGGAPLHAVDLDGDGSPELLLDAYSGGAHCCEVTQILRAGPSGDVLQERNWADPGYRLRDLDGNGRREFVTADASFLYKFTAYAFSLAPPRVLRWTAGVFGDATRAHPAVVRADLARVGRSLRELRRRHLPLKGAIAARTADLYLLGRAADARASLAAAPGGAAFHAQVLRFLRARGYR